MYRYVVPSGSAEHNRVGSCKGVKHSTSVYHHGCDLSCLEQDEPMDTDSMHGAHQGPQYVTCLPVERQPPRKRSRAAADLSEDPSSGHAWRSKVGKREEIALHMTRVPPENGRRVIFGMSGTLLKRGVAQTTDYKQPNAFTRNISTREQEQGRNNRGSRQYPPQQQERKSGFGTPLFPGREAANLRKTTPGLISGGGGFGKEKRDSMGSVGRSSALTGISNVPNTAPAGVYTATGLPFSAPLPQMSRAAVDPGFANAVSMPPSQQRHELNQGPKLDSYTCRKGDNNYAAGRGCIAGAGEGGWAQFASSPRVGGAGRDGNVLNFADPAPCGQWGAWLDTEEVNLGVVGTDRESEILSELHTDSTCIPFGGNRHTTRGAVLGGGQYSWTHAAHEQTTRNIGDASDFQFVTSCD